MRAIHKVYPNARILHAIPNWHYGSAGYRAGIVRRVPLYKALARKHGAIYLSDCEKVLRKSRSMVGGDANHPSQAGVYAIAKAAARQIAKTPY